MLNLLFSAQKVWRCWANDIVLTNKQKKFEQFSGYIINGDVFDGIFLCCSFSREMSWLRSGT